MRIPDERKKVIDGLVADLYRDYDVSNLDELKRASEDRGIVVIQNNSVLIPTAIYHNASAKWYILIRNHIFENLGKTVFAHEMGHAMLNHRYPIPQDQIEPEAEYFQEQLGDPRFSTAKALVDIIATIATKPFTSIRYIFSPSFQRDYNRKLIGCR